MHGTKKSKFFVRLNGINSWGVFLSAKCFRFDWNWIVGSHFPTYTAVSQRIRLFPNVDACIACKVQPLDRYVCRHGAWGGDRSKSHSIILDKHTQVPNPGKSGPASGQNAGPHSLSIFFPPVSLSCETKQTDSYLELILYANRHDKISRQHLPSLLQTGAKTFLSTTIFPHFFLVVLSIPDQNVAANTDNRS